MLRNKDLELIDEVFYTNNRFTKNAQIGGSILGSIQSLFKDISTKPGNTIVNILSEGVILSLLKSYFGWWGLLMEPALKYLGIDLQSILAGIIGKILPTVSSGGKITSDAVTSAVSSVVGGLTSKASSHSYISHKRQWKLYVISATGGSKQASWMNWVPKLPAISSLLTGSLTWVFCAILLGLGYLVTSNAVLLSLGKNPASAAVTPGTPGAMGPIGGGGGQHKLPLHTPSQKEFKQNPSYSDSKKSGTDPIIVNTINDTSSIESLVIKYAKEVYEGLDNLDSIIKSCEQFNIIVDYIAATNLHSEGYNIVVIPSEFRSKKDLVDMFIDEVAFKSQNKK